MSMWTNASVTIAQRSEEYDNETGNLKDADEELIVSNARCVFSQSKGDRSVYGAGYRELAKLTPELLIPGYESIRIPVGAQARVVPDKGLSEDYTVSSSLFTGGIREGHWEVALERIA